MKADISAFLALDDRSRNGVSNLVCFNASETTGMSVCNGKLAKLLGTAALGSALWFGPGNVLYHKYFPKQIPDPPEKQEIPTEYQTPSEQAMQIVKDNTLWDDKGGTALLTPLGTAFGALELLRRRAQKRAQKRKAQESNETALVPSRNARAGGVRQGAVNRVKNAKTDKAPLLARLLMGTLAGVAPAYGATWALQHAPGIAKAIPAYVAAKHAEVNRNVTGREAREALPSFFYGNNADTLMGIKQLVDNQPTKVVRAMLNYVSNPTSDAYDAISTMVEGVPVRSDLWEVVKKNPNAAKDVLTFCLAERQLKPSPESTSTGADGWTGQH